MTNQLPPAPEGFAWMPCSDFPSRTEVAPGDAVALRMSALEPWEHCVGPIETTAPDVCRLMRRLGASERPWGGCAFLGGCGTWAPKGEPMGEDHILNESVVAPNAGWHAPVRFVPNHVPDFGGRGLRYLDDWEPLPHRDDCRWFDPQTLRVLRAEELPQADPDELCSVCVPFGLPPLPILDQMCAEKPGLREGIEREKAAHYAEEIDALRAQLAEVTTERDALNDAAITALSGEVCTPAEGYVKAGANWLKRDIEELVAQRDEISEAVGVLARRTQRLVDIGALSSSHAAVLLDPDVTNDI